jgi:hypothetical protein
MIGVDEPSTPIEIQYLGSTANARILTDALDKLGGRARHQGFTSSSTTDAVEVGLVVVRDIGRRQVIAVVNEILQSLAPGTIGVAFESTGRRRTLEEHKADLDAWVRPKGFTAHVVIRGSVKSEPPDAP